MVESFLFLNEWKNEKVDKDVALLFATIGFFSSNTADEYGNPRGNEDFERITTFNMLLINELFVNDCFDIDEEGVLSIDFGRIKVDTSSFEVPEIDELY